MDCSTEKLIEDKDLNVVNLGSKSTQIEEDENVDPTLIEEDENGDPTLIEEDDNVDPGTESDEITEGNVEALVEPGSNIPVISVGMEFGTFEEAWLLYVNYASVKGFQPRKHTTYRSVKTQETIGRTYVCSKQGVKHITINGTSAKRKRDTRENCPARMRTSLDQKRGIWRVTQFIDEHCHELELFQASSRHQLENRFPHLTPLERNVIVRLRANGLSNSVISKVINTGALNDTTLATNQQCCRHIRTVRESNVSSQCVSVIQRFQMRVKNDPMFFFAVELDANGTIRNVFWADGESRSAYLKFNDVVSFDLSYRTNKFSIPFAPFTGVNHHRQSTLFGSALLADETEDSFVWLFTQWLNCMFDIAPMVIITDHDSQIYSAIKRVFPSTHHRYCSWHVNKHAIEHLGLLKPSNKHFAEEFYDWFHSESIVDSKLRWKIFKAKYNLEDQNWLVTMYEKRKHWVPVYIRDMLTCGMQSSQSSDNIKSFFDGYVSSLTPSNVFVEQYDKAVAFHRQTEKDEDVATLHFKPSCESGLPWEVQASSFYTRKLFEIFHQEFVTSQAYLKQKLTKDGNKTVYRVGKPDIDTKNWRTVIYDISDGVCLTCSCAKFEIEGMLCRHIMAILRFKQILVIPEKYLLKRWSVNTRFEVIQEASNKEPFVNQVVAPLLFSLHFKHFKVLKEASCSMTLLKDYEKSLDLFLANIPSKKL